MCISNLILAIHMQSVNGPKEPFLDSGKKFLQPVNDFREGNSKVF
jgi:hypothetical protein